MGRLLSGDVTLKKPQTWTLSEAWTLCAACLERQGFAYSAPSRQPGESWFLWSPPPNVVDIEGMWGTFSVLLEKARLLEEAQLSGRWYEEGEEAGITAVFWSQDDDGFDIRPQVFLSERATFLSP